jgi:hypothetical protein
VPCGNESSSEWQRRNINLLPFRPHSPPVTPQVFPASGALPRGLAAPDQIAPGPKDRLTLEQLLLSRKPTPLQTSRILL